MSITSVLELVQGWKFFVSKFVSNNKGGVTMKVLIVESVAEECIEILEKSGIKVDVNLKITREELLDIIGDYEGLIVRSVTKVDEELYERATKLKVVGRAGNGIDNIELDGGTKRGVVVVNTPDSNTVSAAEHTIGLLTSSIRNIPRANESIKNGKWERSLFKGVELFQKTLGIVGLGRIGSMVATRMQAFEMNVIAYDPYITDERFEKFGVKKVDTLEELMKESDFISIHTPRTKETLGMIGKKEFALAKQGLRLVNCARGGIIDEDALFEALKEGIVASAALDVLVNEPNTTSPLLKLNNTVITPHLGASTYEAQVNVGTTVAKQVLATLKGELVANAVNLPTLKHKELNSIKLYLKLGELLGKLYYQLEKGAIKRVEITYSGEAADNETSTITLGILKGIFEPILNGRINYVNAGIIAKNRGVSVTESTKYDIDNYYNLITLKIYSENKVFEVAGTIFGKSDIRIVNINGYKFDVIPSKYMLIANNIDKPGMIGKIGVALGEENVNINTMQVSQNTINNDAMMFLTVDSEVSNESLSKINEVDGIIKASFIKL